MLAELTDHRPVPDAPRIVNGKTPKDVYFRLLDCLTILSGIYELNGLETLHVDTRSIDPKAITPSDVFDVASLLVARLDFIYRHLGVETAPMRPYYPGRKFPFEVYQRAGLLKAQLRALEQSQLVRAGSR